MWFEVNDECERQGKKAECFYKSLEVVIKRC